MLLQGDLQKVFDALYHLGVIDPVLEMDWRLEYAAIEQNPGSLSRLVERVNSTLGDYQTLMQNLSEYPAKDLQHLAILVAGELASYQGVTTLH